MSSKVLSKVKMELIDSSYLQGILQIENFLYNLHFIQGVPMYIDDIVIPNFTYIILDLNRIHLHTWHTKSKINYK